MIRLLVCLACLAAPALAETSTPVTVKRMTGEPEPETIRLYMSDGTHTTEEMLRTPVGLVVRTLEGQQFTEEEVDEVRALVTCEGGYIENLEETEVGNAILFNFVCVSPAP